MTKTLEEHLAKSGAPSFESVPRYFKDGDFVAYYVSDELHYSQRIDKHVTVYISETTGKMIGCKIKSVKYLLKKLGDFAVEVTDHGNKVSLGLLFLSAATIADLSKRERYVEIARELGKVSVDRTELPIAA